MKKKKINRTKENLEPEKIRWERFVSTNGEDVTIIKKKDKNSER